jgi:hypothetical protein
VIARAFILLFRPKQLVALAPKRAKGTAKDWASRVQPRLLPAGLFAAAERELEASRAIVRERGPSGKLALRATGAIDMHSLTWWRAEAELALAVARALDERGLEKVAALVPDEDREALLEAVA